MKGAVPGLEVPDIDLDSSEGKYSIFQIFQFFIYFSSEFSW